MKTSYDCSPASVRADLEAHGIKLNQLILCSPVPSASALPLPTGVQTRATDLRDNPGYESDAPMITDDGSSDSDSQSASPLSCGCSSPSRSWNSRYLLPDPKFDVRDAYLKSIRGVVFEDFDPSIHKPPLHDESYLARAPKLSAQTFSFSGYEPEDVDSLLSEQDGSGCESSDMEMGSEPPQKRCRGLLPPADGPSWKIVGSHYIYTNEDGQLGEHEFSEDEKSVQTFPRQLLPSRRPKKFRRGRSAAALAKRETLSHTRPITRRRFRSVD